MDALIVVDMQAGLLNGEPKHDLRGVVERINRLAARVRERSGVVIFVQHCSGSEDDFVPGTPGWALLPEFQRAAADIVILKTLNDPFVGTDLAARLKEIAPERVLITGMGNRSLRRRYRAVCRFKPLRCRRGNGRPHLERPAPPRRRERHSSPPLGLEQFDHAAIGQARVYGRTLDVMRIAPAATNGGLASNSSSRTMPSNTHNRCGIGEYS
jgi:hypothetical protein